MDYLNTEISTSKQKKFSLVTFIDTPGLVDGDMKYPFDVNQSMLWLGKFDVTRIVSFFCVYVKNIDDKKSLILFCEVNLITSSESY